MDGGRGEREGGAEGRETKKEGKGKEEKERKGMGEELYHVKTVLCLANKM